MPPRRTRGDVKQALILFLERKSIKKNVAFALQPLAIPRLPHGNEIKLLIEK
jgi:hypothetical protein